MYSSGTLSLAAMTNPNETENPKHRRIRSFVLRTGRQTAAQRRALNELWPNFGLNIDNQTIDLTTQFGRVAPVVMEIGFGNGENIAAMAIAAPEKNFLGIEVHEPGVGHCLLQIEQHNINNIQLIRHDAVEVLETSIANNSLDRVNLFFPDPWHKKRHNKRRIVQRNFIRLLAQKLRPGGVFHVVTDWPNYAEHIAEVMAASPEFIALPEAPQDRTVTRFDTRGSKLGHSNWERAWCTRSKLPITP
jgi:tRNA (guanine-N7-)-methyltransferase